MKQRTTRIPAGGSDFKVATTKRKAFPARTGIERAKEPEQIPARVLRELEDLRLRIRTLNAINTNLRRQVHKLAAQVRSHSPSTVDEHKLASAVAEQTKQ